MDSGASPSSAPSPPICDCHIHVFGPRDRFPYDEGRRYTPPEASAEAARAMLRQIGAGRAVLVQPSPYGTDNRCLLDALAGFGPQARGVVETLALSPDERQRWHALGVRALRVNGAAIAPAADALLAARLTRSAALAAACGWHLEVNLGGRPVARWAAPLRGLRCPVVLDHYAYAPNHQPARGEYLRAVAALLDSGRCWIKLSAPYRLSGSAPDDVAALVRALAALNPERLVWGSDWPHTPAGDPRAGTGQPQPFRAVDTRGSLAFARQVLGAANAVRVLRGNPQRLYGFG